jgi:hypothetical protein
MDQVEQYGPPPNPAKETDSRFQGYVTRYGHECWELDALDPAVIADLIRAEVRALIDVAKWNEAVGREVQNRAILAKAAENWATVESSLRGGQ